MNTENIRAVAYARYSSTMQNEKSVDSQFVEIVRFAERRDIEIVQKFADHAKSGAADHDCRDQFWKAVEFAKQDATVMLFIVSDSSRFFRNRNKAMQTKQELLKYGVMVEYAMSPLPEDQEQRMWMDGINELMDQTYSMAIGKHTLRGQKYNAQQRDPETGFTYKNGGQVPYGYKGVKVERGKDRFGKTVTKLLWMPDEKTAQWYRYIKVKCRIERRMTYSEIMDDLNAQGIPSPRGIKWTKSVVSQVCKNLTYTGQCIFNKRNLHHPSGKVVWKPVEEWIVSDNAHPPLCTIEEHELEQSLNELKRHVSKGRKDGRANRGPWLLTGLLFCKPCGSRFVGGHGHYGADGRRLYYQCAGYKNHGKRGCAHRVDFEKANIEQFILNMVKEAVSDDRILLRVNDKIAGMMEDQDKATRNECQALTRQLKDKEAEMGATVKLLKEPALTSVARDLLLGDINRHAEECKALKDRITAIGKTAPTDPRHSLAMFRRFLREFRMELNSADINVLRRALRSYFHSIEIDPVEKIISIKKYAMTDVETERAICLQKAKGHGCDTASQLAIARAGFEPATFGL